MSRPAHSLPELPVRPMPAAAPPPMLQERETAAPRLLSDGVILHVSNALQSSLHVKDVVATFARESARLVPTVSVRYVNRARGVNLAFGPGRLHRIRYELNLLDDSLGEMTFSTSDALPESDLAVLEVLLCTLVYPLRNALLYEQALHQAMKDPLTGVNNRASLDAYLKQQLSMVRRHDTPLSLMMVDIDHFKQFNDRFGHLVGDIVLRAVADEIVRNTREADVVFRYGGEEFVIVLANTELTGAALLAERVRSSVELLSLEAVPATSRITASLGVVSLRPQETEDEVLHRADQCMYTAKHGGRNSVVVDRDPLDATT